MADPTKFHIRRKHFVEILGEMLGYLDNQNLTDVTLICSGTLNKHSQIISWKPPKFGLTLDLMSYSHITVSPHFFDLCWNKRRGKQVSQIKLNVCVMKQKLNCYFISDGTKFNVHQKVLNQVSKVVRKFAASFPGNERINVVLPVSNGLNLFINNVFIPVFLCPISIQKCQMIYFQDYSNEIVRSLLFLIYTGSSTSIRKSDIKKLQELCHNLQITLSGEKEMMTV